MEIAPSSVQTIPREAESAELRGLADRASELASIAKPHLGNGEEGSIRAFVDIASMCVEEVVISTRDAILDGWTIALQTTWITPVTVAFVVSIFAYAALPDALRVIKVEVGVA